MTDCRCGGAPFWTAISFWGAVLPTRAITSIDIEASVSRALHTIAPAAELDRIRQFKQLYSRYHRSRDLISVGAYSKGSDPVLDIAISLYPRMEAYLQQNMGQKVGFEDSGVAWNPCSPPVPNCRRRAAAAAPQTGPESSSPIPTGRQSTAKTE